MLPHHAKMFSEARAGDAQGTGADEERTETEARRCRTDARATPDSCAQMTDRHSRPARADDQQSPMCLLPAEMLPHGLEPWTSRLLAERSNQLSYESS